MKRSVKQTRRKLLATLVAGLSGTGLATAVMAAGIGVGVGVNAGANAGAGGANAGAGVQAAPAIDVQTGGTAAEQMSATGAANSNAQWQTGATRGADRAEERTPTKSEDPEEATTPSSKGKRSDKR